MLLPLVAARTAARTAARLEVLSGAGSTNTVLRAHATGPDAERWGHGSLVVTDAQAAGRGRLGRSWDAPPGASLAVSLLLRPAAPTERFGWLPLLAGVAAVRAANAAGADAVLKWPNDVLIDGPLVSHGGTGGKLAGILCELLPDARGVVVGMGLNHRLRADELPVGTATSLRIAGARTDADQVLDTWVAEVDALLADFDATSGDAVASGLHDAASAVCATLEREIVVRFPGGEARTGLAVGIDADARLRLRTTMPDGSVVEVGVSAGDVTAVRPAVGL